MSYIGVHVYPEPLEVEICPKCHSTQILMQNDADLCWLACQDCGLTGPAEPTWEEAKKSWNGNRIKEWKLNEFVQYQKDYIKLLGKELGSAVSVASIHCWESTKENIEMGKQLRAKMAEIEDTLILL